MRYLGSKLLFFNTSSVICAAERVTNATFPKGKANKKVKQDGYISIMLHLYKLNKHYIIYPLYGFLLVLFFFLKEKYEKLNGR